MKTGPDGTTNTGKDEADAQKLEDPYDPATVHVQLLQSADKNTNAPVILSLLTRLITEEKFQQAADLLANRTDLSTDLRYMQGVLYRKLGQKEQAEAALEHAARISGGKRKDIQLLMRSLDTEQASGPPPVSVFASILTKRKGIQQTSITRGSGLRRRTGVDDTTAEEISGVMDDVEKLAERSVTPQRGQKIPRKRKKD